MAEVRTHLQEAEEVTNATIEQIEHLLEQAYLAEVVIQYSNRYRSQYPLLAAEMAESRSCSVNINTNKPWSGHSCITRYRTKALERLEKHIKVPS